MSPACLLGLPLEEAVRRLEAEGVLPAVTLTRAPRRPKGVGALRVVQVREGGMQLVAAAFVTDSKERSDG